MDMHIYIFKTKRRHSSSVHAPSRVHSNYNNTQLPSHRITPTKYDSQIFCASNAFIHCLCLLIFIFSVLVRHHQVNRIFNRTAAVVYTFSVLFFFFGKHFIEKKTQHQCGEANTMNDQQ